MLSFIQLFSRLLCLSKKVFPDHFTFADKENRPFLGQSNSRMIHSILKMVQSMAGFLFDSYRKPLVRAGEFFFGKEREV